MKFIFLFLLWVVIVQQGFSQNSVDPNFGKKAAVSHYSAKSNNKGYKKMSHVHATNNAAYYPGTPYLALMVNSGVAPFKNVDFSPKVQFDYTLQNLPLSYTYSDSLNWPAHRNNFFYGFGLEAGMSNGFYGEFNLNVSQNHLYSFIGMINVGLGYNQPITERFSIRASLEASWTETDLVFRNKRVLGGGVVAFGSLYEPVYIRNPRDRGDVTIISSTFGLIPKLEFNYDANTFVSLRLGVGYRFQTQDKASLDLQATPRVKLDTPGLQFSDGGVPPNQVFNYNGLMLSFTIAVKAPLLLNSRQRGMHDFLR